MKKLNCSLNELLKLLKGATERNTQLPVDAFFSTLARIYYRQDRYDEAEPLSKRALEIAENTLGIDHPNTARRLKATADLYYRQGRYLEAEPLYRRALEIMETFVGKEHSAIGLLLNNLAGLYWDQGFRENAEPLYKRAVGIVEKGYGSNHPTSRRIRANFEALTQDLADVSANRKGSPSIQGD